MDITNFHGALPFLMNEAEGGEGGGGGVAVAEPTTAIVSAGETTIAPTGDEGHGAEATGEETALVPAGEGAAKTPQSTAMALLKDHADPEVKKFANTALRAIAGRQKLAVMFPGVNPVTAVESLQRDMVSLAGRYYNQPDPRDPERRTGIQQIRDKMAEFEEIDLLFYSGDPKILDGMTSDEEGKAAFAKLAPAMKAKWREIAPNAYKADSAREFLNLMRDQWLTNDKGEQIEQADIPHRISRLMRALYPGKNAAGELLPVDSQTIVSEINALSNFVWQIQEMARAAPETFNTKPADSQRNDEREQRIARREAEQRQREWNTDRSALGIQILTPTVKALKFNELSAKAQETIQSLYSIRFDKAVKAKEPDADARRKAHIDADDREGYLAYERYLFETYAIPAFKTEVKEWQAVTAPPANGAQRPATNGAPAKPGSPAARAPQGFIKLSAKPPSHLLDYGRMNADMVRNKQGILRLPHEGHAPGTKIAW